jgi:ubiquinone/menaquinone biosynthesis C-methylase UbiE
VLTDALNACDIDLATLRVLDVGCGSGSWLRQLVDLGAPAEHLTGTDLSSGRLAVARSRNPGISWTETEGQLPFPAGSFDLVMQILVFSSIPDRLLRQRLAEEMTRVTARAGLILWLDLERDLSDKQVTFSRDDVCDHFGGMQVRYEKRVHPHYFRRHYRRPWLVSTVYRLTSAFCDARLLVLDRPTAFG